MIVSAIDVGTNTCLMVTGHVDDTGTVTILGDEHAIPRLGRGVDAHRRIAHDAVERLVEVLRRYTSISSGLGAERIVAFGTSALRDATNRADIVDEVDRRTGVYIEILSGDEEARLSYRGALFRLSLPDPVAVLDIGGGSTEIAVGDGRTPSQVASLDVGAVRISERHLATLPPSPTQLSEARLSAARTFDGAPPIPAGVTVVGVAGTVTTLAALASGIERFDAAELNGRRLRRSDVQGLIEKLSSLDLNATAALPQVSPGRADVILGGSIVLEAFMRTCGVDRLVVSTAGIRYGVLLRELARRQ